ARRGNQMGITPLRSLDRFERAFYIETNPYRAVIHPAVLRTHFRHVLPKQSELSGATAPFRLPVFLPSTLRQEVATLDEFSDR
ncbi:MAG TPA: hypothetical protein VFQ45_01125, partial [Longimicrobium sp.]|nr:hypothetical protein [Longimicrobium sp.]